MSNHTHMVWRKSNAYIRPKNKPELIQIIKLIHKSKSKVYYLGSGSNLLVHDKDITVMLSPLQKQLNR